MYGEKVKRGLIVLFLLLAISSISSNFAESFGVSTPYIKDETLLVNPGKTYEYTVTLQNNENQNYTVDITYFSTDNVSTLEKTEYLIPAYTYNITVTFLIKIPKEAPYGQTYLLEYSAKPKVNGEGTVSMGVEIKRGMTILVSDGTTNIVLKEPKRLDIDWASIGKYILIAGVLVIFILLITMLWRLSKRITIKISPQRSKYTISEAVSLEEVKKLLENINDETYEVSEIKNLFKDKLSELTTSNLPSKMSSLTRKDLIVEIDKLKK